MRKIYISGPMTGIEDHNYPAFDAAAGRLLALGWLPLNPALNFQGFRGAKRADYMRLDIQALLHAEAIYMLTGWQASRGATLEHAIAMELGLEVIYGTIE